MLSFHILSNTLRLKRKGLFDAKVVSITKKEYGFAVQFIYSLESISDERLIVIC